MGKTNPKMEQDPAATFGSATAQEGQNSEAGIGEDQPASSGSSLETQCSAFLRSHASDTISWRLWGKEAVIEAAQSDLPLLVSIGYFSSYWCKRQGEVYQQPEVAATINQRFIPVLVDREEHPDVDRMFMAASATMGCGSGGWPLHVMLTPESKPFFCAHFLEKKPLHEMVGRISKIWRHDREQLIQLSDSASAQLLLTMEPSTVRLKLDNELLQNWVERVRAEFDEVSGGFGRPVKFGCVPRLQLSLRLWRRSGQNPMLQTMVEGSLKGLCCGGMYDHLGGGFFYASLRAAASMAEGGFYLWKYDELIRRLSEQEFEAFQNVFGITEWGNFEDGANHLRMDREAGWGLRADANIGRALTKLKAAREKRETPPVDDKIVVGYNGLVISALAKAYRVMLSVDEPAALKYLEAAQTAAAQLRQNQFRDGVLWRIGSADPSRQSSTPGMLEDYSYTVQAMIDLYQNDFNPAWLEWAVQLQGLMQQEFGGIGKALSHAPLKHSLLPPFQDFGDHGDLPNPLALSISTGL